ncbi:unnamed protein product [Thelazia callipaeda]|uniref:Peptidase A1 domain-containing protein n=1 Tax=Thelazia callipaeda TaxID=103827 RepID=A0A0N5DB70_THECL|nr:unnamed protein product [Thelazia callipaeda]
MTVAELFNWLCVTFALVSVTHCEYRIKLDAIYNAFQQNVGFSARIWIGNSNKALNVLLDTTTPLLWVAGSECRQFFEIQSCTSKRGYLSSESTRYRANSPSKTFTFSSEEQYLIASQVSNNITIELTSREKLKFVNSVFNIPEYIIWSRWTTDYEKLDGVLGLVFTNISSNFTDNPIKQVIQKTEIEPIITLALPPKESNVIPVLTLGAIDHSLCDSRIRTSEMVSSLENRYNFNYSSISVGNATFSFTKWKKIAYIHASSLFITVPKELMQEIVKNLDAEDLGNCTLAIKSEWNSFATVTLGIPFLNQYCAVMEPTAQRITFLPMKKNFMREFANSP